MNNALDHRYFFKASQNTSGITMQILLLQRANDLLILEVVNHLQGKKEKENGIESIS